MQTRDTCSITRTHLATLGAAKFEVVDEGDNVVSEMRDLRVVEVQERPEVDFRLAPATQHANSFIHHRESSSYLRRELIANWKTTLISERVIIKQQHWRGDQQLRYHKSDKANVPPTVFSLVSLGPHELRKKYMASLKKDPARPSS